ncbi:MAG TPA: hypothetical protein VF712_18095 [Thermoleophilaceae bacterium]
MNTAGQQQAPPAVAGETAAKPRGLRLKRVGLMIVTGVLTLNIWTGSPIFALWVGSQVQGSGPPKMSSVFVAASLLAVQSLILALLLQRVSTAYERMTGQYSTVRQHTPWLRSMRGERPVYPGVSPRLTMPERVLVGMVLVVVVIFEIWFFFFSTSPIDQRSGRGALPAPPTLRA